MKLNKFLSLAAAALVCCLALTVPLAASAQTPLEQTNDIYPDHQAYLYIDQDSIYIYVPEGSSSAQSALTASSSYSDGFISWSSSDTSVVTVDSHGIVTGLKSGSAVITASAFNYKDTCTVTVYKEKTSTLNKTSATLTIKYNDLHPTTQLYLSEVANFDGIRQWYSGNNNVATVDSNGTVTAQSKGTATIYATTQRGKTLTCTITVKSDVGKVTLCRDGESMQGYTLSIYNIGATDRFTANVAVADPSAVTITWTSSNPEVVTVDADGVITAVSDGEATITATASTGYSDSCDIFTGTVAKQKREEREKRESSLWYKIFGD